MKYILYARKSTEDKARQILSLESQIETMKKMASDLGLNVVEVLIESKSAKKPDNRPVFSQMMEMLEQGKAQGILCWKLDRLSRNPIDSGRIQWLLQQEIIKVIQTIERQYLPDDNALIFNVESGMANQYIRDLSKNIKRGNKTKLERGDWPGIAPLGYLNDKLNKMVVVDSERAPYIKRLFEIYSTGLYSTQEVTDILYQEGFRTRTGKKVHKSKIHKALSETFYYGVMKRHGKLYQGRHEQVISVGLFEKAQDVLLGRIHTKSQNLFFPFRGILRCGGCGCVLTATRKKGRYDYYYCTNGKRLCEEHKTYLRAQDVEAIVATALDEIQFDEELIEMAYQAKKEKSAKSDSYQEIARENILKELENVSARESRLIDSYLSEKIPEDLYEAKMKEISASKHTLQTRLSENTKKENNGLATLELIKNVFLTANKAKQELYSGSNETRSKILKTLLWNLEIKGRVLANSSFKMPYEVLKKSPKNGDFSQMLGRRDSNPRIIGPEPIALPLGYSPKDT